ncbi:isoprenylcysteine carboxyl methyltransferase family protein [Microvirga sp. 2TAF3]|uniref:isoprenylcysteine carboxyl methyltransferase family protein n=1 Tax=Microvirga sp. 2TAF3 TaxID=3233014 RepID=UPI003F9D9D8C
MLAFLILAFVTMERLSELWFAHRNTKRLLKYGALETAPGHYPLIVTLHAAWLGGLWFLAWDRPVSPVWLAVFVILQILRVWILLTLGRRWTTRIIVMPGEALVRKGPYRLMSHPNYAVVIGEIAVLPLVFGLAWYALIFTFLNGLILTIRIRAENIALSAARRSLSGEPI